MITSSQEHSFWRVLLVLAAATELSVAAIGDWSQFRGPTGMGISGATDLPLAWSAEENVAWKTPLPGPGASSPIVLGERIFVTCYTGHSIPGQQGGRLEDLKRHLIAVDRRTGTVLWNRLVPAKLPEEERIRDHGYAANTPVADGDGVVVFFGKSGVLAFDHDGVQVWEADVGDRTSGWGTAGSLVLHRDLVLVNASVESESLIALDRRTGERRWQVSGIKEAWNTPLVVAAGSDRTEVIIATAGSLKSFSPDTGVALWTCETDIRWYMVPSLISHGGIVYSLGGRSGVASLAIRSGGSGDATASHRLWTSTHGSNVSSPVYRAGHLYWAHDQRGVAYCAKAATGEIVYEQRLERAGQIYASALLANGRLYYLTRDGRTFVLAARPEFELLGVNDLRDGGRFNGSPAVDGQNLLIRSDKFLYCIGRH
jgi:outer membrane protein assembly factor BamB